MACFIVPLTQAIATTIVRKKSNKSNNPWLSQLPKLELMLWGGSLMLVIDHIINGELVFTTIGAMLYEMLCVGVPMSALITSIYICMVLLNYRKARIHD